MKLSETIQIARANQDWGMLVEAIPFARFLGLRIDVKGDEFVCIMPFSPKLIGNPILPALHGGATGGFMECAGIFYLLWHVESIAVPKTIDFNVDYLRSGKSRDTFANVYMVKLGQRVVNIRVEAWQSSPDKQIAVGHGNFLLSA
jgi:uncharacterized protein (TIGR00369 family)